MVLQYQDCLAGKILEDKLSGKTYIRNPKGALKKFGANEQDEADFAQEKLIQKWLRDKGTTGEFEFQYINRKGNARSSNDQKSVRLDSKIKDEAGSETYADIIAGCDGRDLECGIDFDEIEPKTPAERLDEATDYFFDSIGVSEGTKRWAKKVLRSAESLRKLRSLMKGEKQLEISPINLELPRQWGNFRK